MRAPAATIVTAFLLGVAYAWAVAVSFDAPLRGDEIYHYLQVHLFREGDFRVLDRYLTTIPGFHVLVASLESLFGVDSPGAARTINAGFGLVAAAGFHALRERLWPGTATVATAQFLALPILVPLFFLVYTDVLALALLLWALVATRASRHVLSALLLTALVLVRQHDVVWAAFAAALALATWPQAWHAAHRRDAAMTAMPYALPVIVFLGFWAWNGSISLSAEQAQLHPLTLRLGNPLFALLLAGLLLPLHVMAGLGDFARAASGRPWLLLLPLLLFTAYWWGFHADNPYNTALPDLIPRNGLLMRMDGDPAWRFGAGIVIVLAAAGLGATRLRPQGAVLLYPFAALFLAASWLIEQRYALVPIVLWLAFREHRDVRIEWATFALWFLLAVLAFAGIHAGRFFP